MFNCSPLGGHYTPCIKTGEGNLEFLLLECETVAISRLYKKDEDLIEHIERRDSVWEPEDTGDDKQGSEEGSEVKQKDQSSDKVTIERKEYNELKKKSATLDKVLLLLKGQSVGIVKPTGAGVRQREDEGQGSRKGQKKRRVEREFEEVEKIPEYQTGDVVCTTCHKKCKSSNALKLHIEMFHKGDFLYTCNECGKGINTQEGITAHKMAHKPDAERWPCPRGCDVTFGSKKAQANHVKQKHSGLSQKFACEFCKKDTYKSKGNLQEHIMGCKDNPNRIELFCDVKGCHKGGFYLPKKVNEHKHDMHGWQ